MKVKIELTVAVDPQEWAETYGLGGDPENLVDQAVVRDDVKRWQPTRSRITLTASSS